jgi:uncharacterized membrane protein YeaQ/YmgE (transglycosylase-associated protein family)
MEPIGWFVSIGVGAMLGWLAEQFAKSSVGRAMTIVMGIVGSIVANALLDAIVISFGGWLGYFVGGLVGACVLIVATRAIAREA